MWSRVLSALIAGALVFFTIAGVAGVSAVSAQSPKLDVTDRPLDVAISGDGYFRVKLPQSLGGGEGYTRCGKLLVNNLGELTIGLGDGLTIDQLINIPAKANEIDITASGEVKALVAGETNWRAVGELRIYHFSNAQNLRQSSLPGVFVATERSGMAMEEPAGTRSAGKILQGYLEEQ